MQLCPHAMCEFVNMPRAATGKSLWAPDKGISVPSLSFTLHSVLAQRMYVSLYVCVCVMACMRVYGDSSWEQLGLSAWQLSSFSFDCRWSCQPTIGILKTVFVKGPALTLSPTHTRTNTHTKTHPPSRTQSCRCDSHCDRSQTKSFPWNQSLFDRERELTLASALIEFSLSANLLN